MSKVATFLLLFISASLSAQNLIPNPSFETLVTPPCSWIVTQSDFANAVTNWSMPSDGSTDIFSNYVATSCYAHNFSTHASRAGTQAPRTGNAQSAILTYGAGCGSLPNYREYLQATFTSPLTSGQSYDFEFWLSLGDVSNTATNNFGVHFRTSAYYQATCFVIGLTPQFNSTTIITDKLGWVRVNGTITATANWTHMIIGNFYSNAATGTQAVTGTAANTRYFIDDVLLRPAVVLASPELQLHAARRFDGSVSLDWNALEEMPAEGWRIQRSEYGDVWETLSDVQTETLIWEDRFAPRASMLYRVRYLDANGEDRSSEAIRVEAAKGVAYRMYLAGNPVSRGEDAYIRVANADETPAHVSIVGLDGNEVFASEERSLIEWDHTTLPIERLAPGIYFVRLHTASTVLTSKLIVAE